VSDPLPFETASWGRRILALFVDWFACTLVVMLFVGAGRYWQPGGPWSGLTVLVFVLESSVLTSLSGGSFGQLATRLRVVRSDASGRPVGLLGALGRGILIALVIPPLVFRPDGRGLHDLMAGTATVTLDTARGLTRR
jgi:uncharacterized RDD family membrane protein YckC